MSPPSLNHIQSPPQGKPILRPRPSAAKFTFSRFHSLADKKHALVAGRYQTIGFSMPGGTAVIYPSYDIAKHEMVALKVPKPENGKFGPINQQSMERERCALALLDHPNIVRLRGTDSWKGFGFSVLDHVKGSDLAVVLGGLGRLGWPTAKPILLGVCDSLEAVHGTDIVHGDLKPENIILRAYDARPVLIDFGLARFTGNNSDLNVYSLKCLQGTLPYLAPEMIDYDSYDHRADIYGLGLLTYELLTLTNPFYSPSVVNMVFNILTSDPKPPSALDADVPAGVDALVMRALDKDPEKRFPNIADMRDAIAEAA